jgi:hypothetical protein
VLAKKDTGTAMGTSGGGGIFGRKTELVADLTSAFKQLNKELERTRDLSAEISRNLKGAFPGGGAGNLLNGSMGTSTGTKTAQENDGSQGGGGGGFGGFLKSAGAALLKGTGKIALAGLQGIPTVEQSFEQDLLRSRFGFYGGRNANATQMAMARSGTTTDTLDAARATMLGASMGVMPGLKNFNQVGQSAAAISNLMPGVGLSGGMQATAALNQGRNVNMLRMIGVNVRDADGMMRGFQDIAKDLWKVLNKGKTGEGAITKEQISFSLQPGNALDSMLNQYFGNDPILRQSVISELMLLAGTGGKGSSLNKATLAQQGATTSAVLSSSDRNAASLNATQAVAPSVLKGFEAANDLLAAASNKVADIARDAGLMGDAFRKILEGKGFVDTIGASGNGAGAGILGVLGGGAAMMAGKAFGGIKNFFTGGPKGATGAPSGGGLFGKFGKFMPKSLGAVFGRGALAAGTYAGMDKLQDWLNNTYGGPEWLRDVGNFAFDTGQGALTGLVAGGLPGAIAGTAVGAVQGGVGVARNSNPGGQGGSESYGAGTTNVMPFQGNYAITSPFGTVRHLVFNGNKSPSYGKPHGGIDYGLPEGTPVYAVADGTVEATPYDAPGFGNYIKLVDANGAELFYGHLSSKVVPGGARVKAGDLVGYSGNSGQSTGAHLHFEVRKNGTKMDPSSYLSGASSPSIVEGGLPTTNTSDLTLSRNPAGLIIGSGGPNITSAPDLGSMTNGGHGSSTINYGGVNITFQMPEKMAADPKEIAREVKKILSSDNIRQKAVSK